MLSNKNNIIWESIFYPIQEKAHFLKQFLLSHGQISILRQIDVKSWNFLLKIRENTFFSALGPKKKYSREFYRPQGRNAKKKKKSYDNFMKGGFIFSPQTTDIISSYHLVSFKFTSNQTPYNSSSRSNNSPQSNWQLALILNYSLIFL